MCARWALLALAVVSAVAAGCGPKVKPGLGVVGEKTLAKFDRPMVAADKLGVDVADAPVRITPALPGKFRWLYVCILAFVADEALPRSTRFELEARRRDDRPGRPWSREGGELVLRDRPPAHYPRIAGRWATPDQRIAVSFQPAGPGASDVEKRCGYASDARRVAAVVDNTGETEDARLQLRRVPARAAGPGDQVAIRVRHRPHAAPRARLASRSRRRRSRRAQAPTCRRRRPLPPNQIAFETYGPMKVMSVKPRGGEISTRRGTAR